MPRTEHDLLGAAAVPDEAAYGVHTWRASRNFPVTAGPVPPRLIRAFALVKKACALTNAELGYLPPDTAQAIAAACDELAAGRRLEQFPVDALQGGAGTSTNMNVNEVIANLALERLDRPRGDYATVHPLDHVNRHQSTNDTYPTALKVAALFAVREVSAGAAALQGALQRLEKQFADVTIVGSTERMDAVPLTLGAQFGSFAEAVARDRWRTFKCEERLRVVNLGGTALVPAIGYEAATTLAERLRASGRSDVMAFLAEEAGRDTVDRWLSPEAIMALGFPDDARREEASP
jgi:aspartate ammonia-lyase